MIGRRKSPDGLPFRLYPREGKFKVSYGYKLPDGSWAFRLTANKNNTDACARIKQEAIDRANELNGEAPEVGTVEHLFKRYFAWQDGLPADSEDRKAADTLKENKRESQNAIKVFGKMRPPMVKPKHIYGYLDKRAEQGAPAKANKEVALFSAVMEYGRRKGEVEINPCLNIKYNKTMPRQKRALFHEIEFALKVARERGGSYPIVALCLKTAYLTTSRPDETRALARTALKDEGIEIAVGKRRRGQVRKTKLIYWSPLLRATIDEAKSLQRVPGLHLFGNSSGQIYTRSGFNTTLTRLMVHCEKKAIEEGVEFSRFNLMDMRPASVSDRVEAGEDKISNATGHSSDRMIKKVYDRTNIKKAKATK